MLTARYDKQKIAAWFLLGILLLSVGLGVQAGFRHSHDHGSESSHVNAGGDTHCRMLDAASIQHDCDNHHESLQQTLRQHESNNPLLSAGDWQLGIANDWAGLVPLIPLPPNQRPHPNTFVPAAIPFRLSFCCLRT